MLDPSQALASTLGSSPGCRSVAASRKPTCEVLAASEMAPSTAALCACKGNNSGHRVFPAAMSVAAKRAAWSMVPANPHRQSCWAPLHALSGDMARQHRTASGFQ